MFGPWRICWYLANKTALQYILVTDEILQLTGQSLQDQVETQIKTSGYEGTFLMETKHDVAGSPICLEYTAPDTINYQACESATYIICQRPIAGQ